VGHRLGIARAVLAAYFWVQFLVLDLVGATASYSGWGSRLLMLGFIVGTGVVACALTVAARRRWRRLPD
jgi:hypothetical protein